MDLVGHSLAGENGATQVDYGAWHKIATHLQPARVKSVAQGGAFAAGWEGMQQYATSTAQYGGYLRALLEWPNTQQTTLAPYLPNSQLVCVWYGINDLAWLGPANISAFTEALTTIIARFKAAMVFEDSSTSALWGITPIAYTGVWSTNTNARLYSGTTSRSTTTTYPTSKVTITIPPDYGAGTIQIGLPIPANGDQAVWDVVDVTAGGATTLLSGYDARNRNGFNHASTRGATGQPIIVTPRVAIGAAPATTLTADLLPNSTTITVASTAAFDTAGTLTIETERISYTGKTGTTFTGLTRLISASSGVGALHYSGASVTGSRTVELRPTTITGAAYFDFWALEAVATPLVAVVLQPRSWGYTPYGIQPYSQTVAKLASNYLGANVVTLASTTANGAVAASGDVTVVDANIIQNGSVIIDSEVMLARNTGWTSTVLGVSANRGSNGTTAATHLTGANVYPWVRVGDTITVGTGATAETRTVTGVAGAAITFGGAVLSNAHSTGEVVTVGIQDYDITNTLNPAIQSAVTAFADSSIFAVNVEPGLYPTGAKDAAVYNPDTLHYNNEGHQRLAKRFLDVVTPRMTSYAVLAKPTVPDSRGWYDSLYSQVVGGGVLLNSWANYSTTLAAVTQTGAAAFAYTKDFVTGRVTLRGAVKQTNAANANLSVCVLPVGFRPLHDQEWMVATEQGPQVLRIQRDGNILLPVISGPVAYAALNVQFEAEL